MKLKFPRIPTQCIQTDSHLWLHISTDAHYKPTLHGIFQVSGHLEYVPLAPMYYTYTQNHTVKHSSTVNIVMQACHSLRLRYSQTSTFYYKTIILVPRAVLNSYNSSYKSYITHSSYYMHDVN